MKKKFLLIAIIILSNFLIINAQSFKVRSDEFIQIGYDSYKTLSFGIHNGTPNNGQWAIESGGGGLNIWKPWPSVNDGNYKLFIRDDNGYVGIGRYPSFKLDVNGDIATYGVFRISSDKRLKTDIKPLYSSLEKLIQLNGVSYKKSLPKLDINQFKSQSEQSEIKRKTFLADYERSIQDSKMVDNFGFVAQELQILFPELVSADNNGYLTIDYVSLIPVIIEALKEVHSEIDNLKSKLESSPNGKSLNSYSNTSEINNQVKKELNVAKLYQNTSNPVNVKTEIKYYLPEGSNSFFLGIYDLNGNQIKRVENLSFGYNSVIINNSELSPGIYIYSLIIEGQEVDTKRMILSN